MKFFLYFFFFLYKASTEYDSNNQEALVCSDWVREMIVNIFFFDSRGGEKKWTERQSRSQCNEAKLKKKKK